VRSKGWVLQCNTHVVLTTQSRAVPAYDLWWNRAHQGVQRSRSWSKMTSGTKIFLDKVWGSASVDVFAVGKAGTILHYAGP